MDAPKLKCVVRDKLDPIESDEAKKWVNSSPAPISEPVPLNALGLYGRPLGQTAAPLGRNVQSLLRSEALVGGNRFIGEKERSPFSMPDHGLNGIEKVARSPIGIPDFTRCLQIVPSNLEGVREDGLRRLAHEERTLSGLTRSFRQPLKRTGPQQALRRDVPVFNISIELRLDPCRLRLPDGSG
jgi:hypothetical protein